MRACQIGTHQHDRLVRKQPRYLRGLREGLVPQRLTDHGETRARDESHEERPGGQGQPQPIPGGGHARQQGDDGQGAEEHREREDDRDVPPHRFHLQARLQRVVQILQADDAEEQAHNGQPRCGVGAPDADQPREAQRREAEHRPGDVPTQPDDRLVEPARRRRHAVDAVGNERSHGGPSPAPPRPPPRRPAERRHASRGQQPRRQGRARLHQGGVPQQREH